MKVKELVEALEAMDPEARVVFAYAYGDRVQTIVTETVDDIEEGEVVFSAYHRREKLADDEREDEGERSSVVVLNGYCEDGGPR